MPAKNTIGLKKKPATLQVNVHYTLCSKDKCKVPTPAQITRLIKEDLKPMFKYAVGSPLRIVHIDKAQVTYEIRKKAYNEYGPGLFENPDDDGNFPVGKYLFHAKVMGIRYK